MQFQNNRIVVITPCRNEERYLPDLINSMVAQSLLPSEWIIVDDGSTDQTNNIARKAETLNPWIQYVRISDRGQRSVGPGVVDAFYYGFNTIRTTEWDYICKLDADIELPKKYFEVLLSYFDRDPYLGAASGKWFFQLGSGRFIEERTHYEAVLGSANFYRRKCFEESGGFIREVMWDGIVFHRARMAGWRTRSIRDPNLRIIEKRMMGSSEKNIIEGRLRWGRGQYFMGTHPIFILAIGVYRAFQRPFFIGGLCIVLGYFWSMLKRKKRYDYPGFRESLHAWQCERLGFGQRLEQIPPPSEKLYIDKLL